MLALKFPPVPGKYQNVIPFDFASLYPTTIIAYNIDYHTWVPPDGSISDSLCHVMEWEDHIGCEHDDKVIRKNVLTKYIVSQQDELKKLREKEIRQKIKRKKAEYILKIKEINTDLSPYIKERSEITKTITKFYVCETKISFLERTKRCFFT